MAQWWRIGLQCRRPGFDPWVGKIPWRRAWQWESHGFSEESAGLQSIASHGVRPDWSSWAAAAAYLWSFRKSQSRYREGADDSLDVSFLSSVPPNPSGQTSSCLSISPGPTCPRMVWNTAYSPVTQPPWYVPLCLGRLSCLWQGLLSLRGTLVSSCVEWRPSLHFRAHNASMVEWGHFHLSRTFWSKSLKNF